MSGSRNKRMSSFLFFFFFSFLNDSSISVTSNGIHLDPGDKELYAVMFVPVWLQSLKCITKSSLKKRNQIPTQKC